MSSLLQSVPPRGPRPSCAERGPASRFCRSRSLPCLLPFLFQPGKMAVETVIGLPDHPAVESFFARPRFVAGNEQDRLSLRVEGESHSPFAIRHAEAQFLHVRVPRSVQSVDARPPQLRPELLKKARQGQNLRLHVLIQRVELPLKLIADLNNPTHVLQLWSLIHMMSTPYYHRSQTKAIPDAGRVPCT